MSDKSSSDFDQQVLAKQKEAKQLMPAHEVQEAFIRAKQMAMREKGESLG